MKKILVANRGEIALRIMRSIKEMGLSTVAVFSEADRKMPFVRYADEAVCIGPAPANESYLCIDKIIEVCKELHVDAVHPGYGFLSENAAFAQALEQAGVILIGPTSHSIQVMGDKLSAKAAVAAYDIPLIPGSDGAVENAEIGLEVAEKIGFPVMIKASAGGGGKGMRIVRNASDFSEQFPMAVREAEKAFGNGAVFIEKYIVNPRHIEIQVLADSKGNIVHLFERECSIQRRHQKVIEEAPSAFVDENLRREMGKAAVDVAKSCGYVGAGTVEFVVDANKRFYFLEMNTRLQVEHPVTEMITGVDLVKEQIRIARGEVLGYGQNDLTISGHAMEVRVYAEDPSKNFLPSTGILKNYNVPTGRGVRVDDGYEEGAEIPVYYDPMISKLITHGGNRAEAILKMRRAIEDYRIVGVETTLEFCDFVLAHDNFITGDIDTGFVEKYFNPNLLLKFNQKQAEVAAIIAASLFYSSNTLVNKVAQENSVSSKNNWAKNRQNL